MERTKNRDCYVFRCVANRIAQNACTGNRVREGEVEKAVLEQLLLIKDMLFGRMSTPSANVSTENTDHHSELNFVEAELIRIQSIARGLYENLISNVIDHEEYSELKAGYNTKEEGLNQRASALRQLLANEKSARKREERSLQLLNVLAETRGLTHDYVEHFVQRVVVFGDGRVHLEVETNLFFKS